DGPEFLALLRAGDTRLALGLSAGDGCASSESLTRKRACGPDVVKGPLAALGYARGLPDLPPPSAPCRPGNPPPRAPPCDNVTPAHRRGLVRFPNIANRQTN